jgi:hypothetical protein
MFVAKKYSTHSAVQTSESILHLFQLQILAGQVYEFNFPFLAEKKKIFLRLTPRCETNRKGKEKTANNNIRLIIK